MYYGLSLEELRSVCKNHIENVERWARIFIHQILSKEWGDDYIHAKNPDGNYKIKTQIVNDVDDRMKKETTRFKTFVDAMYLREEISILCRADLYKVYFNPYFKNMYPEGASELRTFLKRLNLIRNKLSHANPISIREAEQCVCYSNDFIDCIKEYYRMTGQNNDFNIPKIIKVNDSFGNEYPIQDGRAGERLYIMDRLTNEPKVFYLGEKFTLYLTLDPSFDENSYKIVWNSKDGVEVINNGKQINVTITNKLIGETEVLFCKLITTNEWHRWADYDQQLIVHFKAVPRQTT